MALPNGMEGRENYPFTKEGDVYPVILKALYSFISVCGRYLPGQIF
jgi:hypothetical protein